MRTRACTFAALFVLAVRSALAIGAATTAPSEDQELQRWKAQRSAVTIVRDDLGIAHIHGATDANAVFGLIYAQAEDDFNRVENNYIRSLGRLAEAEGEAAVFSDLRMKLFVDPEDLKARYASSPSWLKQLMNAWADGLNYFLATHPQVKPRVIKHFEPWMTLSFSEGSIGGDIERISTNALEAVARTGPEQRLKSLAGASQRLLEDFGSWRTPWGEINRFQRLNDDFEQTFDRYASGDLREVYFYDSQLQGHTERTYHPGE